MQKATLEVRLSPRLIERLGELSRRTSRAEAALVVDAIADFVERELPVIEGIERGFSDLQAGRIVPHDEAMRRARWAIERAWPKER